MKTANSSMWPSLKYANNLRRILEGTFSQMNRWWKGVSEYLIEWKRERRFLNIYKQEINPFKYFKTKVTAIVNISKCNSWSLLISCARIIVLSVITVCVVEAITIATYCLSLLVLMAKQIKSNIISFTSIGSQGLDECYMHGEYLVSLFKKS